MHFGVRKKKKKKKVFGALFSLFSWLSWGSQKPIDTWPLDLLETKPQGILWLPWEPQTKLEDFSPKISAQDLIAGSHFNGNRRVRMMINME